MRHSFLSIFIIFNLIIALFNGVSEGLSLQELLKKLDATLEWEPVNNTGSIIKGDYSVNFKVGSPFLVMGPDRLLHTQPLTMAKNGTITFPPEVVTALLAYFSVSAQTTAQTTDHTTDHSADHSADYTLAAPKIAVILLDPGHGGKDPGAIGKYMAEKSTRQLKEKDLVLKVAEFLRVLLVKQYPSKQILLTREADTYLSLEERIEKANTVKVSSTEAVIFISLHVNASFSSAARGFEVWYLPPQYKRNLIDKEDVEDENQDLIPILNNMLDVEYTTESILLAKNILAGIDEKVGAGSPNRGLKAEKWFVVHKSKMPSVLIELGFITNQEEASRLSTDTYLQALAFGIYNGLTNFIRNFENSKSFTE